MKKIILGLLCCGFLYGVEIPDPYKGQVYYKYFIAPKLKLNEKEFTKKFTKEEWKKLYKDGGKGFLKEFNTLEKEDIAPEVLSHLEAFSIYYAKDSGSTCGCGN